MPVDFTPTFSRTDAEVCWAEFVSWIGFSNLTKAIERKNASLEEWMAFQPIAPKLFSIEIGLNRILRRWRSTRKLSFPKEQPIYDGYSFVICCMQLRRQLTSIQAEAFRQRVISEMLPSGRLCHLDHEFRIAQNLLEFGWEIIQFGFCGDPGPDFVARRGTDEIELEGKCLSPEIGLGISYEFAARLLSRVSKAIKGKYPGRITMVTVEVFGDAHEPKEIENVKSQIIDSYVSGQDFRSATINVSISFGPLKEFMTRFPHSDDWVRTTFNALRRQEGDYGYFLPRDDELIFCNLIPQRRTKQVKKILTLISNACEKQFSKNRPAMLWLHLQGLSPKQIDTNEDGTSFLFDRLARHTFQNKKRDHVCALAFSSDADAVPTDFSHSRGTARGMTASGRVRGFDNLLCRFGVVPIFTPYVKIIERS